MSDTLVNIILQAKNQASPEVNAVTDSIRGLNTEAKNFLSDGYSGLESAIGTGLKAAAGVGVAAIAGIGAAIGSSVSKAANFEAAMSNVAAISRASDAELDQLTQTAKQLGATTAFTSKEAAEGMSFLAMAGFETNDIISAMPGLLSTAAAGNIDLATTADIVSNVLSGFGMQAEETGRVADVLAATFTSANTDLSQLGDAMKYVAPVANTLGIPVEQAAAAIGKMGDAGIQGSMAGTSLRMSLLRLASPTGDAEVLMRELGISAVNADGSMKALPDIMASVEKGLEGMSESQKAATLQSIVGVNAIAGFSALLDVGADTLSEYTGELEESGGVADEIANKQLDNLHGAMTLMNSAIDGVMVGIGDAFLPILTDLVRTFTDLVQEVGPMVIAWFKQLAEWLEVGVEYLRDLWQTGDIFNDTFSQLPDPVQAVIRTLVDLYERIRALVAPIWQIIADFVRWEDVLVALGIVITGMAVKALAALVAAAAPVIAVAAGLVAAVALLRNAWENDWLGIRTITLEALEYIKALFAPVVAAIQAFGGAALAELWAWVRGNETNFWAVRTIWETVKDAASKLFTDIVGFIQENLPIWVETLKQWGTAAWEWVKEVFPIVMGWVLDLGQGIIDWLMSWYPDYLKMLGKWAAAAWEWLRDTAIPKAVEFIGKWGGALWGWLTNNISEWGKKLGEWAAAAWTWLRDTAIPKAVEQLRAWREQLFGFVNRESKNWGTRLAVWGKLAWEWIKDVIPEVLNQIMSWRKALFDFLRDNLPLFVGKIGEWAVQLIEWIGATIPEVIREFGEWLESVIRWGSEDAQTGFVGMIGEWIAMLWQWVMDDLWPVLKPALLELLDSIVYALGLIADAIWDKITDEWIPNLWKWIEEDLWPKLGPALGWLAGQIGEALGAMAEALWEAMKTVGKRIVDGMKEGINNAWTGFTTWLNNQWQGLVNSVKGFFGIRSPSMVFSEIGKNLMAGMEQGINSGKSAVETALDSVRQSVDGTIASITHSINGLSNVTIMPPKVKAPTATQDSQTFGMPSWMSESQWFALSEAERQSYMNAAGPKESGGTQTAGSQPVSTGNGTAIHTDLKGIRGAVSVARDMLSQHSGQINNTVLDDIARESLKRTGMDVTYPNMQHIVANLHSVIARQEIKEQSQKVASGMFANIGTLFSELTGTFDSIVSSLSGTFRADVREVNSFLKSADGMDISEVNPMFLIESLRAAGYILSEKDKLEEAGLESGDLRDLARALENIVEQSKNTYEINLIGQGSASQQLLSTIELLNTMYG